MSPVIHRAGRNLGLLLFIALPLGVIALVLQTMALPPTWMRSGGAELEPVPTAVFQMLVLSLPILAGGLIHQLLLWFIPGDWSRVQRRSVILLSALVIPALLLLFGNSASVMSSGRAFIPLAVIVVVYGLTAVPLRKRTN